MEEEKEEDEEEQKRNIKRRNRKRRWRISTMKYVPMPNSRSGATNVKRVYS